MDRWGSKLINDGDISFYQFIVSFMGVYFSGQATALAFSFSSSECRSLGTELCGNTDKLLGFTKANQAANYYFWLDGLEGTVRETDDNRDKEPEQGCSSYDFQDVKFSYPLAPDNQVLRGVSLSVSRRHEPSSLS